MSGTMDLQRPSTPVHNVDDFQLKHDAFTYRSIARVHRSRLEELLHPNSLKTEHDQLDAVFDAQRTITKPWLNAQLKLYGIDFNPKSNKAELEETLSEAVDCGNCDNVALRVETLERDMRRDYQESYAQYKSALGQSECNKQQAHEFAYDALDTASAKADFDLELFMKEYFLDASGNPDPAKTQQPLALPGVCRILVHRRAESVPGLETVSGGSGGERTLCIGWSCTAVWNKAHAIVRDAAEQRQKELNRAWQQKMDLHRTYKVKLATIDYNGDEWYPEDCCGAYAVECPELEEGWDSDKNLFKLHIDTDESTYGARVLVATFDFGVVEGCMHLATNHADLPHKSVLGGEEDETEQEDDCDTFVTPTRRQAHHVPSADHRPAKRVKITPPGLSPRNRCLHFMWRGRDTGEGEIQNDDESQQGFMDFDAEDGTSFVGRIHVPFCGDYRLRGYKINPLAAPVYDAWEDYSDEQYEYERVARWR